MQGYPISENFMIGVKSNVHLNNSSIGVFGEVLIEMLVVYTIKEVSLNFNCFFLDENYSSPLLNVNGLHAYKFLL